MRRASASIERDDVHLGVVEHRALVEVRRADREPPVVDDADLRVDVDEVAERPRPCVERAGEEALVAVVRVDQRRDRAARDVGAVVRARRQHRDDPEVVARRVAELVHEDRDDLGRPEELVLEVDEALGAPQRPPVRLEHAELALRHRDEDVFRDRAHDLQLDVSLRRLRRRAREAAPRPDRASGAGSGSRRRRPPGPRSGSAASCQPIWPRDGCFGVSNGSPPSSVRSMPPTNATSSSTTTIFSWCEYLSRTHESVSAWMLVPRVNTFMYDCTSRFVGRNTGNGAPSQTRSRTSIRRATSERRLRRTTGLLLPREVELGREAPAEQMDVRPGAGDRLGDRRQVRRAVDEHLDAVPAPRLETSRRLEKPSSVRVEGVLPADLPKPPPMVARDGVLDSFSDRVRCRAGCRLEPETQRRGDAARLAALVAHRHPATLSSLMRCGPEVARAAPRFGGRRTGAGRPHADRDTSTTLPRAADTDARPAAPAGPGASRRA